MSTRVLKLLGGAALLAVAHFAQAAGLVVHTYEEGAPFSGASVEVDGAALGQTDGSGTYSTQGLSSGEHTGAVSYSGSTVTFEFTVSDTETAMVTVTAAAGAQPTTSLKVVETAELEQASAGSIQGQVLSAETGGAIAGARVSVSGTDFATTTDDDGSFQMELPRGTYDIRIAHPEYGNRVADGVAVLPGMTANVDLQLSVAGDAGSIEEVVAVASYVPDTGSEQERSSAAVLDVIDSEQIARFGDSTAAAALTRVAGLTIQDDKYAVVRGLTGRYNTTTFNGAAIPSTDPTKRVVPLDMFPAGVLDTVNVQKSWTPDQPGDATGGAIMLTSREFPAESMKKISVSLGYNDIVTGEDVAWQQDGSTDYLGFDDGSRELPTIIDAATDGGQSTLNDYNSSTREALGEVFDPRYGVRSQTATPNLSLSLNTGNSTARGDNEFGYLLGFKYKNGWSLQEGEENTYQGDASLGDDFDYERAKNSIELGGLLSLGANIGYNHKFTSNSLLLRSSFGSTKVSRGIKNENNSIPSYKVSHEWTERQILSQQFLGEHIVPAWNEAQINWRLTTSQAKRLSPDLRSFEYDGSEPDRVLRLVDSTLERRWDEMTDQNNQLGADLKLPLGEFSGFYTSLKTGFDTFTRERDSEVIRFGYLWRGDAAEEREVAQTLDPDAVLIPENIRPDGYELFNKTVLDGLGSTFVDSYEAQWDLNAWYLMGDIDYQGKFQVVAGARVEESDQTVTSAGQNAKLEEDDVLPALSATWFVRDDIQIRAGWSETVSRPDFTELAPSAVIDPEFGFPVVGNPDLKRTEVENLDLRAEWYFSPTESISLAFFEKDFTNPIERTLEAASGTASDARTFDNADSATNEGIELDFRKELYLGQSQVHSVFFQGNYAWIDSEVDLGATSESVSERPLQGQSDYIINLQIGYDHLESGQKATLIYNEFGERIALVDKGSRPPVYEQPFTSVKVNYEKELNLNMTVSASIDNLLDEEVEFTQFDKVFRKYKPGRTFEVGFSYQF
jgi:TonB-dependent receptor